VKTTAVELDIVT